MNSKIRIAIVEDEIDILTGLQQFLLKNDDFMIVATATYKDDAISMALNNNMDVILMDLDLSHSEIDGLIAANEILLNKNVKIIVVTGFNGEETVQSSFLAGAVNCVFKNDINALPDAIRQTVKNPDSFEGILPQFRNAMKETSLTELTLKQRSIFIMYDQGYSYDQIAEKLQIAQSTLKTQVHEIMRKLEVKSMKSAIEKVNRRLYKVTKRGVKNKGLK